MSSAYPLFVLHGDFLEHLDLLLIVLDLQLEVHVAVSFGLFRLVQIFLLLFAFVLRVGPCLGLGLLVVFFLGWRLLIIFVEVRDFQVFRDDKLLEELDLAV